MRAVRPVGGQALLILLALAASVSAQDIVTLDVLEGVPTVPSAINARGDVVGSFLQDGRFHGFLWSGGEYTVIDITGAQNTQLTGLNDRGDIIGFTDERGFLLRDGSPAFLRPGPNGELLAPRGINNQGDIVGSYFTLVPIAHVEAFVLDARGAFSSIRRGLDEIRYAGINDSGQIVGSFGDVEQTAFVIDRKGNRVLIGGPTPSTRPTGINARGDIVGYVVTRISPDRGFVRHRDGTTDYIEITGAPITRISGINARGDIVGWYSSAGQTHGFLLTR